MTKRPNVLVVREYDSIRVGTTWEPAHQVVPAAFVARLAAWQAASGKDVFDIGHQRLRATNYVGTLCIGAWTVDVLPKVDDVETQAVRSRLVEMLEWAGIVPHVGPSLTHVGRTAPSVLDVFLLVYIDALTREWRRGRIRSFRRVETNRTALRGKLRLVEHLRRNRLHFSGFYTAADELIGDVPIAQLLKAGLDVCYRAGRAEVVRRAARTLLPEFETVSDVVFTRAALECISVDRLTERFRPLVELAKLLVTSASPDRAGSREAFALMFDMNVVFEKFVANLMRRILAPAGLQVRAQFGGQYLLRRGERRQFRLRPDIQVFAGRQLRCILDTKWKRLDSSRPHHGVSSSDAYQAYAYGREFDCRDVVLLYPSCSTGPERTIEYGHGSDESFRLRVATVDVGLGTAGVRQEVLRSLRLDEV